MEYWKQTFIKLLLICFIITGTHAHYGHQHLRHPFIDKRAASSVLSHDCVNDPEPVCCTDIANEVWCEQPSSRSYCGGVNEYGREEMCRPTSCPAGHTCYLRVPCKAHYQIACDSSNPCLSYPCERDGTCVNTGTNAYTCSCPPGYDPSTNCAHEINECNSNPCQNGATCLDHLNKYTCTCVPGYTGVNCETDIDECDSMPCLNGGTCNDRVNHFTCNCTARYTGTICEKDCRPGPVDLLFVVDTSSSSESQCQKAKQFMTSFVSQLPVGPDDFQVAAVTYSFTPVLAWNLTSFTDNQTVIEALNNLVCNGGATYTSKAFQLAIEVFKNSTYGARLGSAFQQIILLTDGMSTDRNEAIQQSWNILANNIRLFVVGNGHFVDHYELHSFVHDSRYVFSPTDDGALNQMLLETAHADCIDCEEKTYTDIYLLLDSSSPSSAKFSIKAAVAAIGHLNVENTNVQVGVTSYADDVNIEVQLGKYLENDLLKSITRLLVKNSAFVNVTKALEFGKKELISQGRVNSKRLLILFSDGNFNDTDVIEQTIKDITDESTTVIIVGTGSDINHGVIRQVVVESHHALLSVEADDFTFLQAIRGESFYTVCNSDIFYVRHLNESKDVNIGCEDVSLGLYTEKNGEVLVRMPKMPVKRKVQVKIVFLKIGEIDTVGEKFHADVFIQARWREPLLDHCQHLTNLNLSEYWNPLLIIQNLIDHSKRKKWQELSFTSKGHAYIVENRRIKGNFSERLELKEFPFDAQSLNVVVTSELSMDKLDIEEDQEDMSSINVACFVDEQEWSLLDYVECLPTVTTKQFSPNKNVKFPSLELGCCAARRSGFFIWNVILIMAFITTTCFTTFAVKATLPQNRLQLSITLMLTAKVFKLITINNLPKISYNTRLDRYILFCIVFIYLITIWHAFISRFEYDEDLQQRMDNWAFLGLVLLYVTFLAVYSLFISITYVLRQRVLQEKLKAYEEKATKLLGTSWKDQRSKQQVDMSRRRVIRRRNVAPEVESPYAMVNGFAE